MKKTISLILVLILSLSLSVPALAADTLDKAVSDAAAFMLKTVKAPEVGSVGGEWAVIGLARSGYSVPESYYQGYYTAVEKYVKDCKGVLHDKKYTEYSRVILGLTAAGYDPRDVAGYDLTKPLEDFDKTIWQGINGPIWALIALDSLGYENSHRDDYITEILNRQLNDGGWNLGGGTSAATKNQKADSDLTGMALQALSRYQARDDVKAATNKALDCMSKKQDAKGGFSSDFSGGSAAVESVVQMLVALTTLGIPIDDSRFVKNGYSMLDNVMSFALSDGSFKHTSDGSGDNQMSTEQAFYGLVAAQRARDKKNTLYDMTDAKKREEFKPINTIGLPAKHKDVSKLAVTKPGTTFSDISRHASKTAVEALASREIINGEDTGRFNPDGLVTRAAFAKMVSFTLGLPEKTNNPFTDVLAGLWYTKPIATAYCYEIVKGTGNDKFNPTGNIARQDAALMIARAAKLCGMDTAMTTAAIRDTLAQFGDYRTVSDYASEALAFCYANKILDDSEFNIEPKKAATRAEIAEMLYNLLDRANLL